jgi:phage terminase Nu1 subunit (DNA packaging protein)
MEFPRYISKNGLHKLFGIDRRTIDQRLENLQPVSRDGRSILYDIREAVPLILKLNTTDIDKQLKEEQLRYEKARADKVELEVKKTRRELISIAEISPSNQRVFAAVRAGALAMPKKLALTLCSMTDPIEIARELEDAVNEWLGELQLFAESELRKIGEQNESVLGVSDERSPGDDEIPSSSEPS